MQACDKAIMGYVSIKSNRVYAYLVTKVTAETRDEKPKGGIQELFNTSGVQNHLSALESLIKIDQERVGRLTAYK